jgi:hypothetical protein
MTCDINIVIDGSPIFNSVVNKPVGRSFKKETIGSSSTKMLTIKKIQK